jgi:endonuclease/exonuclease/phosphatase family metal-dependent hydrolase
MALIRLRTKCFSSAISARSAVKEIIVSLFLVAALHAETLTIATYNIENYGPADRVTEAGFRKDYPKPEAEKAALRRVLRGLNADVVVLQEMGGTPYLDELRHDLKAEGLDYPHAAVAAASDADRHLAILSKRPLKNAITHTDLEFTYFGAKESVKRGLLEVTLATEKGDLTLFGLHLKSRFTDRADDPLSGTRRAGEATAIRDRVLKRFPDPSHANFVMLGDCNDVKTSAAIARLEARGKTPIGELLSGADSRGEVWSHAFRREESYSRVDQIFVSPGLHACVVGGVAHVYDGDEVLDASDHRPVFVVLSFDAKK